ncbi:hypothetical protein MIB92_18365 [Aestuariirhabdus sp. Z084]|uniref:hypothetical protein n=1 Tax=Aestuariirhabdus haliotis TaxID=2918751 RepID=UPI00201B35B7|nr:hypothetical protein [Aestuariirhabdus haliotis]MCL6417630.1 hypothetical protein [Aestuariirhabdus haliotis]MCL6421556.1 hypothetical protein [Aestuariirhabdus haliotis]
MTTDLQDKTSIKKSILMIQLLTLPATIALGLGLYGVVAVQGDAFHPVLNNREFCYFLIVISVLIDVIAVIKLIPLFKAQKGLAR